MKVDPIPFETFASFERLTAEEPLLSVEPPAWAAAAHAIVVDEQVHYLSGPRRRQRTSGCSCTAGRRRLIQRPYLTIRAAP